MKAKVQNNARGTRGGYLGSEPYEIASGSTKLFDNVSDTDIDALAAKKDFRVQKSVDGAKWEDVSDTSLPMLRPFLAIGSGSQGEKMRVIPLEAGEWFIGTAIASDAPDGQNGYEWVKIGAAETVAEPAAPLAPVKMTLVSDQFDAAKIVDATAPDVIGRLEGLTAEQLAAVESAEEAGQNRKGVLAAIKAKADPFSA